jgi:hypothetical protein
MKGLVDADKVLSFSSCRLLNKKNLLNVASSLSLSALPFLALVAEFRVKVSLISINKFLLYVKSRVRGKNFCCFYVSLFREEKVEKNQLDNFSAVE